MLRAARFADRAGRQFNGNSRLFRASPHGRDLHEFLGAASGAELIAFRLHASQKLVATFTASSGAQLGLVASRYRVATFAAGQSLTAKKNAR